MGLLAMCIAAVLVSTVAARAENQEVIVNHLDNCPDYPNLPNHLNDTFFQRNADNNDLIMSGTLTIGKEIVSEGLWLRIKIKTCLTPDNLNSCRRYSEGVDSHFCENLSNEERIWLPIIAALRVFYECPISEGETPIVKSTISLPGILKHNMPNGAFTYELLLSNTITGVDYPNLCLLVEGTLRNKRRKRKKKPAKEPERSAGVLRRALV